MAESYTVTLQRSLGSTETIGFSVEPPLAPEHQDLLSKNALTRGVESAMAHMDMASIYTYHRSPGELLSFDQQCAAITQHAIHVNNVLLHAGLRVELVTTQSSDSRRTALDRTARSLSANSPLRPVDL